MKSSTFIILCLSVFVSLLLVAPAAAQQQSDSPTSEDGTANDSRSTLESLRIPTEVIQVWRWPDSTLAQPSQGIGQISRATIPDLIPPLPFEMPQVGPVVKEQLTDIDTRTRAFEPKLTDGSETFEFPADLGEAERWIRVDLTAQTVTAYEGLNPLRSFLVSTGVPGYNTVTGEFRVRMKVSEQVMSGGEPDTPDYYYLPEVKWVMYFYEEFALHGSYWHDNFGTPMSHGCVNMTNADAKWLFDFAGPVWDGQRVWYKSSEENPGSRVIVHY